MQETQEMWVWSLGWEDPLEKVMAIHSSIVAWRIPMDRGAWQTPWGCKELDMTEWLSTIFPQPSVAGSFHCSGAHISPFPLFGKSLCCLCIGCGNSPHSEAWHSRLSHCLSSLTLGTGHTGFFVLFLKLPYIFIPLYGEWNGSPLQYSYLENLVDRGAWWAAVHRVVQSWTRLKQLSMHACMHYTVSWRTLTVNTYFIATVRLIFAFSIICLL